MEHASVHRSWLCLFGDYQFKWYLNRQIGTSRQTIHIYEHITICSGRLCSQFALRYVLYTVIKQIVFQIDVFKRVAISGRYLFLCN